MKELKAELLKHLFEPGQTVYIQNTDWRRSRNNKVGLISFSDNDVIDFLMSCHGKAIVKAEFENIHEGEIAKGKKVQVNNGQMGIVLSSFHWTFSEEEISRMLENKEIEKEDEAGSSIISLVLSGDMLMTVPLKYLNAVEI